MIYAGFWRRAVARTLDVALAAPVAYVFGHTLNPRNAALLVPVYVLALGLYIPYFHATRGRTPGKRILGINVVNPDGSPIGWNQSLRRSAPECLWAILTGAAWLVALNSISDDAFAASSHHMRLISASMPAWFSLATISFLVWDLVDVGVMVASREKRSLHDRLGGTVVSARRS